MGILRRGVPRLLQRGSLRGYTVAVLACGLATLAGVWLAPLGPELPMAVYLLAVLASAWVGGLGPASLASLLSTVGLYSIFFLPRPGSLAIDSLRGLLPLTALLLTGLVVASLAAGRRRAEQRLAAATASEGAALALNRAVEQRATFLAEVGTLLAASLDFDVALDNLAHLAVDSRLADWCIVDVFDPDGALRRVAAVHGDPARQPLVTALQQRYGRLERRAPHTLWKVLLPEQPWIDPAVDEVRLEAEARDPEHFRLLRDIGFKSEMVVPLTARGHTLGAITLVRGTPERPYGAEDLNLAQELARRAGLAADNARLYAEAQRLNAELEQRVRERTAELEQSQEELRQLSAHLNTAREEERARIAREIHDELGGSLTGVKMDVARLRRMGSTGTTEWLDQVEAVSSALDATVKTVRRIATELRPAILDDFGLVAAIEWQLKEFQNRSGLACDLQAGLERVELSQEAATALFRVFQETLTNIARHAQASQVEVRLYEQTAGLVLQVRDNGRGIDPVQLTQNQTFGLMGMRERVRMLSGQLDIHSGPDQGTTVVVQLPLHGANGHKTAES